MLTAKARSPSVPSSLSVISRIFAGRSMGSCGSKDIGSSDRIAIPRAQLPAGL